MSTGQSNTLHPLNDGDCAKHADLLYSALNTWFWMHGLGMDSYQG